MKIKIIDLLNKIANNEEVPKKIRYRDKIWEFRQDDVDYKNGDTDLFGYLFQCIPTRQFINDEVEVIEENKKIKKIDTQYFDDERYTPEQRLNVCMNYINDLIDEINKMKEGK